MNRINDLFEEIKNIDSKSKETIEVAEKLSDIIFKLSDARIKKGMTQRQLAEASGIRQSAIARMESLRTIPRLDTVIRIAQCLGVQLNVESSASAVLDLAVIENHNVYYSTDISIALNTVMFKQPGYSYAGREADYAVIG